MDPAGLPMDLARLQGQAQAIAAARGAYRELPEFAQGTDHAGAVTVTLTDRGTRVARVTVAADWKNRVGMAGLGMAVMEAVMTLQFGPVNDFFTALNDFTARPGAAPPAPTRPSPASIPDLSKVSWDDVGDMLDVVNRAFDALNAATTGGPGERTGVDENVEAAIGRSVNHWVEVILVSGQLASVSVDEKWAGTAGRQQLSASLNQAFESAYNAATPPSGQGPAAGLAAELESILRRTARIFPAGPDEDHLL